MEPTDELIDSIYFEKVERARRQSISQKLLDGARLFKYACEASRMGIRLQNPDASADEIERLLRERLELGRRLQEQNDG